MTKQISSLIAFLMMFIFAIQQAHATPSCTVTDSRDRLTNSTFRYKVEETNYGNSNGGCTAAGTQDGLVVSDWINFQTSETNPTDGNTVDYIELNPNLGPVEFFPQDYLLIGNYSHEALNDLTNEIDYSINTFGSLGYFYSDANTIKDWGRIVFDARNYADNLMPFTCVAGASNVYLRNIVLYTNGVEINDLLSDEPATSCFKNGGSLYVCNGDPILIAGATPESHDYVDPTSVTTENEWCAREGCSTELITVYRDTDGDGYGTSSRFSRIGDAPITQEICPDDGIPTGYIDNNDDCNDNVSAINPDATEICDGVDNDCNGTVDEGFKTITYYRDIDGDGFGDATANTLTQATCVTPPVGYVTNNTDCDDTVAAINPAAIEICDSIDNNCDGNIDEGFDTNWYADVDGDTYGDASSTPTVSCTQPTASVANNSDCDDANTSINPAATEICDSVDNNCDGSIDEGLTPTTWYFDGDGDLFGAPSAVTQSSCAQPQGFVADATDCDDTDALINPLGIEICEDGIDQDCDGADVSCGIEICNDGIDNDNNGLSDCSDPACVTDPICNPESCDDGIDNDGDGLSDCEDPNCGNFGSCNPEICTDGIDNDSDGLIDCQDTDCINDNSCTPEICDDGIDNDGDGLTDCNDPVCFSADNCGPGGPGEEQCSDNLDNDGDGFIDCQDYDCIFEDVCTTQTETQCNDDDDNDGDGLVDCFDPDCDDFIVDVELGTTCIDLQVTPVGDGGELAGGGGCSCDLTAGGAPRKQDGLLLIVGLLLLGLVIGLRRSHET